MSLNALPFELLEEIVMLASFQSYKTNLEDHGFECNEEDCMKQSLLDIERNHTICNLAATCRNLQFFAHGYLRYLKEIHINYRETPCPRMDEEGYQVVLGIGSGYIDDSLRDSWCSTCCCHWPVFTTPNPRQEPSLDIVMAMLNAPAMKLLKASYFRLIDPGKYRLLEPRTSTLAILNFHCARISLTSFHRLFNGIRALRSFTHTEEQDGDRWEEWTLCDAAAIIGLLSTYFNNTLEELHLGVRHIIKTPYIGTSLKVFSRLKTVTLPAYALMPSPRPAYDPARDTDESENKVTQQQALASPVNISIGVAAAQGELLAETLRGEDGTATINVFAAGYDDSTANMSKAPAKTSDPQITSKKRRSCEDVDNHPMKSVKSLSETKLRHPIKLQGTVEEPNSIGNECPTILSLHDFPVGGGNMPSFSNTFPATIEKIVLVGDEVESTSRMFRVGPMNETCAQRAENYGLGDEESFLSNLGTRSLHLPCRHLANGIVRENLRYKGSPFLHRWTCTPEKNQWFEGYQLQERSKQWGYYLLGTSDVIPYVGARPLRSTFANQYVWDRSHRSRALLYNDDDDDESTEAEGSDDMDVCTQGRAVFLGCGRRRD